MKGKYVFLVGLVLSLSAHAQIAKLSVTDMQSDLDVLYAAIREVHPGYGFYMPADRFEQKYAEVRLSIREPMTEEDFVAHMYPFLCALGCGHTQFRHTGGYHPGPAVHLPFEVLVRGKRAWITTRKTAKLTTGDELISMNGVPVSVIIRHGYSLYCGDGYIPSFKELYLSEYDGFEDVCHLYYHWKPPYRLSVRAADGAMKNVILGISDTTAVAAPVGPVAPDKYAPWSKVPGTADLGLYVKGHTALLEVPSLNYADTAVFGYCFGQIARKDVKNLILDMRHNGGGDLRIAIRLMSFLVDTDFGIIRDLYARLPDPSVNSYARYFDPGMTDNFKESCLPGRREGGVYHMDVRPVIGRVYDSIPPADSCRFMGNLVVLIDGATFSSSALFVTALKAERGNVRFVGRETAGAEEGCNGFAQQLLTLPATHVSVQFPWLHVVSMAKSPVHGRGLIPDIPVDLTPQDVVSGNDPDLAAALHLFRP
jgi:hypothetical protein